MFVYQPFHPLSFPLTLRPRRLLHPIRRCIFQLPDDRILSLAFPPLRNHSKSIPLCIFLAIRILQFIKRVIKRIRPSFLRVVFTRDT